jgi:hypothetical protein
MGANIGRNDPCWCGSGQKYKKCHLNKQVKAHEINNDFKNSLKHKICKVPADLKHECTDTIVKAHTVSKSANLKNIARDGKVYGLSFDMLKLFEKSEPIGLRLMHINQASTFYIFCSEHDKRLFAPLEDKKFDFTNEQLFLLAYRIASKAIYLKEQQIQLFNSKVKHYDNDITNNFQNVAHVFSDEDSQLRDVKYVKKIYDNDLLNQDYGNIKHYSVIINKIPEVMVAGAFIPSMDFQGNELINYIDNYNKEYNAIFTSIIKINENKGALVFSWNESIDSAECEAFIKSLDCLSAEDKIKAISCLLFKINKENLFISPTWYESLSIEKKELIRSCYIPDKEGLYSQEVIKNLTDLNIIPHGLSIEEQKELLKCIPLSDDDISNYHEFDFFDWKIIEIKTNIEDIKDT